MDRIGGGCAKAIGRTKELDAADVVSEGVLAGERKSGTDAGRLLFQTRRVVSKIPPGQPVSLSMVSCDGRDGVRGKRSPGRL